MWAAPTRHCSRSIARLARYHSSPRRISRRRATQITTTAIWLWRACRMARSAPTSRFVWRSTTSTRRRRSPRAAVLRSPRTPRRSRPSPRAIPIPARRCITRSPAVPTRCTSRSMTTGALSFKTAPDFEAPADVYHDNSYQVVVRASDGSLSDDQTITVDVADVSDQSAPGLRFGDEFQHDDIRSSTDARARGVGERTFRRRVVGRQPVERRPVHRRDPRATLQRRRQQARRRAAAQQQYGRQPG